MGRVSLLLAVSEMILCPEMNAEDRPIVDLNNPSVVFLQEWRPIHVALQLAQGSSASVFSPPACPDRTQRSGLQFLQQPAEATARPKQPPVLVNKADAVARELFKELTVRPTEGGDYRVPIGDRFFVLHLPKGYDGNKPMPCLALAHGSDESNPLDFGPKYSEMNARADSHEVIVVYPIAQPKRPRHSYLELKPRHPHAV